MRRLGLLALLALVLLAGCGGGSPDDGGATAATDTAATTGADAQATTAPVEASGRVLRVPGSYRTIQSAVDASRPGDLVLIAPGVYHEAVEVTEEHPGIVIRGVDRNRTILDGRHELADGIKISTGRVAVENLTVRNYAVNGVIWFTEYGATEDGQVIEGWRASYLTASNNGLYGVYAFGVRHGRFDHVYASGHPDSGIYIGRCKPCNALVTESVTELNHVGLEFTNASGDVVVRDNVTRRNRVGVQVNSLSKERTAPQVGMTIEDNDVSDNQAAAAPRGSEGFAAGIVINGGRENVVRDNRVSDHDRVGIVVLDSPDYAAEDNRVEGNVLRGNRVGLALQTNAATAGNCFARNRPGTSDPPGLEQITRCGESVEAGVARLPQLAVPPQVDYRRVAAPPAQLNMPQARTAPAEPADGRPEAAR